MRPRSQNSRLLRLCFSLFFIAILPLPRATFAQTTREVSYSPRSIVRVDVISGAQNLAYVKPAKAGASTNLNLVTAAVTSTRSCSSRAPPTRTSRSS